MGEQFKVVASNRRATHDYEIVERFEAGLVLHGSEVKSLRAGNIQLKDSYATVERGEVFLIGAHIGAYSFANRGGHEPERTRKLLLNRREIDRIAADLAEKGLTLVPLRVYFKNGIAKIEVGLGRGRRTVDKRHAIREREMKREMDRSTRRRR